MISQFFILSPRGDAIIYRDFLGNVPHSSRETYFRHSRFWRAAGLSGLSPPGAPPLPPSCAPLDAPPVFMVGGVTYLRVREAGLDFVATTRDNPSPSYVLEFLRRVAALCRDYLGALSEEGVRRNFVLVYELLDEAIDYGVPQTTATEALKSLVVTDPVVVVPGGGGVAVSPAAAQLAAARHLSAAAAAAAAGQGGAALGAAAAAAAAAGAAGVAAAASAAAGAGGAGGRLAAAVQGGLAAAAAGGGASSAGLGGIGAGGVVGPSGVYKSVMDTTRTDGRRRDEIFVDVVERLTATFSASGSVVAQQVDGSVLVRSYLAGNPPIRVKFNDDLVALRRAGGGAGGAGGPGGGNGGGNGGGFGGAGGNGGGGFSAGDFARGSDDSLVILDDVAFHEACDLSRFDAERAVVLVPPDGEFALATYRASAAGTPPPFRLSCSVEPDPHSETKAVLTLRLWADGVPRDRSASGLEVEVPVPRGVLRAHCEPSGPHGGGSVYQQQQQAAAGQGSVAELSERDGVLRWRFRRVPGGSEASLRARLTLARPYWAGLRSDVGPVNLRFTIPMYAASKLKLQYLQVAGGSSGGGAGGGAGGGYGYGAGDRRPGSAAASGGAGGRSASPQRWVRYVTSSSSYTFRT
jgi:AP-4 complex subunit mu-1